MDDPATLATRSTEPPAPATTTAPATRSAPATATGTAAPKGTAAPTGTSSDAIRPVAAASSGLRTGPFAYLGLAGLLVMGLIGIEVRQRVRRRRR